MEQAIADVITSGGSSDRVLIVVLFYVAIQILDRLGALWKLRQEPKATPCQVGQIKAIHTLAVSISENVGRLLRDQDKNVIPILKQAAKDVDEIRRELG